MRYCERYSNSCTQCARFCTALCSASWIRYAWPSHYWHSARHDKQCTMTTAGHHQESRVLFDWRTWAAQDSSGEMARGVLGGLLEQWGDRLGSRGTLYQALHNPLSGREGVPWLPLSRPLFTGACSSLPPANSLLYCSQAISLCIELSCSWSESHRSECCRADMAQSGSILRCRQL